MDEEKLKRWLRTEIHKTRSYIEESKRIGNKTEVTFSAGELSAFHKVMNFIEAELKIQPKGPGGNNNGNCSSA